MLWTLFVIVAYFVCGVVIGVVALACLIVVVIGWVRLSYCLLYSAGYLTARAREVFRAGYRAGER